MSDRVFHTLKAHRTERAHHIFAESGDQEGRLHLQTMIPGDWSMRKCNTVVMKKVIDKQKINKRPYILKVQMHKLDENRTRLSLCGCGASVRLVCACLQARARGTQWKV